MTFADNNAFSKTTDLLPRRRSRKLQGGLYDWNRLWYRKYSNTPYIETSEKMMTFFNTLSSSYTDLFNLESLEHVSCLILLGEPGLGKTTALQAEYARIIDAYGEQSVIFVDLEAVDSNQYIRDLIFNQQKYKQWQEELGRLHIFLDSLDRTRLPKESVIQAIINELRNSDISNLSLRIVCRDIDWSFRIAESLKNLWQIKMPVNENDQEKTYVQVYQLAPLRHEDIVLAAKTNGIDAKHFLETIDNRGVSDLAKIPLILEFMLARYKKTSDIGNNRRQLYREACQQLCELYNAENIEKILDTTERLQYAQTLMAILVLGNKYAITNDIADANINSSVIYLQTFSKELDKKAIEETLSTSLFKGTGSRTWVHRSVAEYMTAEYLIASNCEAAQIIKILTGTEEQFAEQIIEVVRWLIEIAPPSISDEIVKIQPELFLTIDTSAVSIRSFGNILHKLLNLDNQYEYIHLIDYLPRHQPTSSTELSQIVKPYLEKFSNSDYKRRFVIELICAFSLPDLDDELVNIVFDVEQDYVLRRLAARAIYKNGLSHTKERLKPLIYGIESDPYDELKGYALLSLYPDSISAEELFDVLHPPKRESYTGSYVLFIDAAEGILKSLEIGDLPIALKWASNQPSDHEQRFVFHKLTHKIMQLGWDNFHLPLVQKAFATAALSRITNYDPIFGNKRWLLDKEPTTDYNKRLLTETNNRHELVILLSQQIIAQQLKFDILLYSQNQLLTVNDFEWVIGQLNNNLSNNENNFWANILCSILARYGFTIEKVKQIRSLSARHTNLYNLVKELLQEPDDAQVIKKIEQKYESMRKEEESLITPHNPLPSQCIEDSLKKIEDGDYEEWIHLVFHMLLRTPTGRYYWSDLYPDITLFPGWVEASEENKLRILNAAKQYLSNQKEVPNKYNENNEHWLSTDSSPWVEIMGYLAIFLYAKHQANYMSELIPSIWYRWADAVVWYPIISGYRVDRKEFDQSNHKLQQDLVKQTLDKASSRALSALKLLIQKEDGDNSYIYSLQKFERAWNEQLEKFLMEGLKSSLAPKSKASILEFMLKQDSKVAKNWAESLVKGNYASDEQQEMVIDAIVRLMQHASEANWSILWNAMNFSDEIGVPVIEKVADWHDLGTKFLTWLDENEIADLYIWLERKYPSSEDPEIDGVHAVSTRESIGNWRNRIHTHLRNRKTEKATEQIERIAEEFPDVVWLQYTRLEAQRGLSEIKWKPSTPEEVISLHCKNPDVKSEESKKFMQSTVQMLLEIIAVVVAIIALIVSIINPEIRNFFGLPDIASTIAVTEPHQEFPENQDEIIERTQTTDEITIMPTTKPTRKLFSIPDNLKEIIEHIQKANAQE